MSTAAPSPADVRLSRGTIARYATGSLGTGGFATLPGLVLAYYLTDSLGVAALVAGLVITVAKVWDVIIDPIIGALTDRDLARHGTRRRLMLIGALALPVLFALTFAVPPSLGPVVGAVWVFFAFTLTATAFSLFQVPYIALPAELTPSYDERTRLLTWRVVVLTFAILLFGAGGPELRGITEDPVLGYLIMGIVAGVVIAVGMLVATTVAQRPVTWAGGPSTGSGTAGSGTAGSGTAGLRTAAGEQTEGGGIREHYSNGIRGLRRSLAFRALLSTYLLQALATGLMLAGAQYVATWVLHSEQAVTFLFVALIAPALFAAPGWGVLARRIGKERAFSIASVLFACAALTILGTLWAPGAWIYVPVAVAGVAYAGMQSLPMSMLPDVISHDERTSGPGQAGSFSGVWTAGETIGFALGATTLSIILAVTGYVSSTAAETVTQPSAAITGIVVSFSLVPAVLVGLSLLTLARYPLRRTDIESRTQ
ncbi:MFS transporter [Microbacterium pumilum]|uniref:MFS transporter n=1 Tax=Microbacterium pumilum TaxID=344165 RepID=A0ABN2S1W4_9MICO